MQNLSREEALDYGPGRWTATIAPASGRRRPITGLDIAFAGYYLLLIGCHLIAARQGVGWSSAVVTDALACVYLLGLALSRDWRPLILRLCALGLVAGVCELATDAAGEGVAHSLFYPAGTPMLFASPIYMPVSWMVTLAWLGYLAWRLSTLATRPPLWVSVLVTGLAGAITVPYYEQMAYLAGWWHYYLPVLRVGHVPIYVVVFEGAVAALLPRITPRLLAHGVWYAAVCGIAVGIWMPVAAFVAWLILGR
jgi:hypothetical protein